MGASSLTTLLWNFVLKSSRNFCCSCCFSSSCSALLRRIWLHFLYDIPSDSWRQQEGLPNLLLVSPHGSGAPAFSYLGGPVLGWIATCFMKSRDKLGDKRQEIRCSNFWPHKYLITGCCSIVYWCSWLAKTWLDEVAGLLPTWLFSKWYLVEYEKGKRQHWVMTSTFYLKMSLIPKMDLFCVQTLLVVSQNVNGVCKLTTKSHSKWLSFHLLWKEILCPRLNVRECCPKSGIF